MTNKSQPNKEAKITEVADEVTQEQLDLVAGGKKTPDAATPKLYEAASKGKHIPQVTIE
jgi:type VI protein secretion system component Hcp